MRKPPRVPVLAGKEIRAIIPDSLDEAFRLAQAFVQGGIAPRGMQRPEQVMIAILAGLEVGLRPLQAVQAIYIVNGRPQLFGDALVAVVRSSGRCRYIKRGHRGRAGENLRAWCETLRVGEDEPVRETFSWQQAKQRRPHRQGRPVVPVPGEDAEDPRQEFRAARRLRRRAARPRQRPGRTDRGRRRDRFQSLGGDCGDTSGRFRARCPHR